MTVLSRMQDGVARAIAQLGTTLTYAEVARVLDTATGAVTETVTTHSAVPCTDLYDESQAYDADSTSRTCTARVLLRGDIEFTPQPGGRVTYQSRVFAVVEVAPSRVGGGVAAWALGLREVGTDG